MPLKGNFLFQDLNQNLEKENLLIPLILSFLLTRSIEEKKKKEEEKEQRKLEREKKKLLKSQ